MKKNSLLLGVLLAIATNHAQAMSRFSRLAPLVAPAVARQLSHGLLNSFSRMSLQNAFVAPGVSIAPRFFSSMPKKNRFCKKQIETPDKALCESCEFATNCSSQKWIFNHLRVKIMYGHDEKAKNLLEMLDEHGFITPPEATLGDDKPIAFLLECDTDADLNEKNSQGRTIAHLAAEKGLVTIAEMLVEHYEDVVDLNCRDGKGETPLSLAIKNGHENVATTLLRSHQVRMGLRKIKYENSKRSALHLAIEYECVEAATMMLNFLVESGDKIVLNDDQKKRNRYCVELLVERWKNNTMIEDFFREIGPIKPSGFPPGEIDWRDVAD